MNKKFLTSEILNAVDSISPIPIDQKERKETIEKILNAVDNINSNQPVEINKTKKPKADEFIKEETFGELIVDFKQSLEKDNIESQAIKINPRKNTPIKREIKSFTKPLLLTVIVKYKPSNTKLLFLNKLHNSKIKIITMMPPGASK